MTRVLFVIPVVLLVFSSSVPAQDSSSPDPPWNATARFELRANFRDSTEERFQLRFPFEPRMLPPGAVAGFEETVDAGAHAEVSLVSVILDVSYAQWFAARARIDAVDLYDRNPTSGDRTIDADELWIRFG